MCETGLTAMDGLYGVRIGRTTFDAIRGEVLLIAVLMYSVTERDETKHAVPPETPWVFLRL